MINLTRITGIMPKVVRSPGHMVMQNSESAFMAVAIISWIWHEDYVNLAAESEGIGAARSMLLCLSSDSCDVFLVSFPGF
jgi:hypothetical protein